MLFAFLCVLQPLTIAAIELTWSSVFGQGGSFGGGSGSYNNAWDDNLNTFYDSHTHLFLNRRLAACSSPRSPLPLCSRLLAPPPPVATTPCLVSGMRSPATLVRSAAHKTRPPDIARANVAQCTSQNSFAARLVTMSALKQRAAP